MKKNINNIKWNVNPYVIFVPFLIFAIIFVVLKSTDPLWGDEAAYLLFAKNLLHGTYSPPPPDINLDYGPGYPLFLAPFLALNSSYLLIKLMNPIFYYFSIVFLYKAIIQITNNKRLGMIIGLFWALYYNAYYFLHRMHPEIFVMFLVTLLILLLLKAFNSALPIFRNKYIYLAGFIFGYIALTKVIFGYVYLTMFIGLVILWIFNRKSINYKIGIFILITAFATTLPYLIYTYKVTDRIFYWASTSGNNMYWLANPVEGEYANWLPDPEISNESVEHDSSYKETEDLSLHNQSIFIPGAQDSVNRHHSKNFEEINKYKGLARNDALTKIAIQNILNYPAMFVRNCFCNISRMLFNYPNAYMLQKPSNLSRFPLNGIILIFMIFSILPTIINWRKIIFPIRFIIFFAFIYLGGSVFGSAESRMFTVIAPMLIFWISSIVNKTIKINLRFDKSID